MKALFTRFAWLGTLLLALTLTSAAPLQNDPTPAVGAALANGSSRELAQYLAPSVDVGFDSDIHNYNATQTELIIKNFFAKNPVTGCAPIADGASNGGVPYVVYRYSSRNGNYSVFVRLHSKQGTPSIEYINITKQ